MHTTSEYDAFGPWIDEVRTVDDLPGLFRNAGIDPADHQLVLKVPRNIARRDATPGMHLYDHLLAAGETALTVLTRHGGTHGGLQIPYLQITAIEESVALLDGRLTVHTASGAAVTVAYNGSASAPVGELVRLLRERYLPSPADPGRADGEQPGGLGMLDLGTGDIDLVTASGRALSREPGMRLVAAVGRHPVRPGPGWRNGVTHWLRPVALQASVVAADDREVLVFHRRDWFAPAGEPVWSLAQTALPRAAIGALQLLPHERYRQVQVLVVHAGPTVMRFPAPAGPGIEALLAAFAGARMVRAGRTRYQAMDAFGG